MQNLMSEPGDYGMCPVLGWNGFKNPLELGEVEMPTLEGLCLCPFPAGEDGRDGEMEVELPDFSSKLPVVTNPPETLELWCPRSLNRII